MCINLLKNTYWQYPSFLWLIIWVCPFGASAQSLNCKDAILSTVDKVLMAVSIPQQIIVKHTT